jgi:hypothetical protein
VRVPNSPTVIAKGWDPWITDSNSLAPDRECIRDVAADFQLDGEVVYANVVLVDGITENVSRYLSVGM